MIYVPASLLCNLIFLMKLKVLLVQSEMNHELNFRQQSKEGLAKTAGNITENLMSIAKMMESQVQQSRNNTEVLSKYFPIIIPRKIHLCQAVIYLF